MPERYFPPTNGKPRRFDPRLVGAVSLAPKPEPEKVELMDVIGALCDRVGGLPDLTAWAVAIRASIAERGTPATPEEAYGLAGIDAAAAFQATVLAISAAERDRRAEMPAALPPPEQLMHAVTKTVKARASAAVAHADSCPYCREAGGADARRAQLCVRGRVLYDLMEAAVAQAPRVA